VQKEPAGNITGVRRENIFHEIHNTRPPFPAALLSSDQQQPSQQIQQQSSVKNAHQDTNKPPGQSVQAKSVNSNTTYIFFAFALVEQITLRHCSQAL
jgi:hypothetical protein